MHPVLPGGQSGEKTQLTRFLKINLVNPVSDAGVSFTTSHFRIRLTQLYWSVYHR